jgi:hypothetical protein
VVDFGDKTIDLSVSSRVTKLDSALRGKSRLLSKTVSRAVTLTPASYTASV